MENTHYVWKLGSWKLDWAFMETCNHGKRLSSWKNNHGKRQISWKKCHGKQKSGPLWKLIHGKNRAFMENNSEFAKTHTSDNWRIYQAGFEAVFAKSAILAKSQRDIYSLSTKELR